MSAPPHPTSDSPRASGRWSGIAFTLIGLTLVVAIGVVGGRPSAVAPAPVVTVALALATGDLGDRAFNDSAYAGLQRAQRELRARFRVAPFRSGAGQVETLRALAQERPDLLIAIGQENAAAVAQVAAEYPSQRFAIIDSAVAAPNVSAIVFRELEGDFLAGALSALLSPNGSVGFLGGADVPVIRRIEHGWRQGVQHINPGAQILVEYIGGKDDFSGFGKPDVGMQLTSSMFERGAGVVYTPAGRSALGAIAAAEEHGALVITTGADQRYLAPAAVATSRTKNMDAAVFTLVQELAADTLAPGVREIGLDAGGVGLAPLDGSGLPDGVALVPAATRERIATIMADLQTGRLVVEEYRP
jgi:basic membrane protein A